MIKITKTQQKKSIPGSLRARWKQNVLSVEEQNDSKIDDRVEIIKHIQNCNNLARTQEF